MRIDRLTNQLQLVLSDAQSLAVGRDHSQLEPIHMLFSMLEQKGAGSVRLLLSQAGFDVAGLREALNKKINDLPSIKNPTGDVGMSPEMGRLLNLADRYAQKIGDKFVSSDTVLLVAMKDPQSSIKVEPSDRNAKGDALKATWDGKKSGQGNLAIYGSPLDLSNLENDGALYIEIKVITPPNANITIGMDCGYPCGGKVPVGKNLKQLKRNEWDVLPIPLNCLTKAGLDLKKVNGPLLISTDGKLQIELGNVKLLKLAEGDKGCMK
jgi:hypothetical protein